MVRPGLATARTPQANDTQEPSANAAGCSTFPETHRYGTPDPAVWCTHERRSLLSSTSGGSSHIGRSPISNDVIQVPGGSLYSALHRLEQRKLIASEWGQTDNGREAKFYRLSRLGKKQLEAGAEGWQRLSAAVGLILAMSEGGAG